MDCALLDIYSLKVFGRLTITYSELLIIHNCVCLFVFISLAYFRTALGDYVVMPTSFPTVHGPFPRYSCSRLLWKSLQTANIEQ